LFIPILSALSGLLGFGTLAPPSVADPTLLAAFVAGLLSFISPCVLPLIPGYLSFISGISIDRLQSREKRAEVLKKTVVTSIVFILGFSTVFILIGAAASAVGQTLREYQDILSKIFSFIILIFALHFLGVYRLKFLAFEKKVHARVKPMHLISIYLVGMAFAFGWTPCVGPILASITAIAATQGKVWQGVLLLSAYSLGLGVPFLLSGLGLFKLFGRLKPYLRPINIASGVLLTLFGVLMLTGNVGTLSTWFSDVLLSIPFLRDLATI